MKSTFTIKLFPLFIISFILSAIPFTLIAQTSQVPPAANEQSGKINLSSFAINNLNVTYTNNFEYSLAYKPTIGQKWGRVNLPGDLLDDNFKTWESEKHFLIGVGEIAILEFIPWALAKWIRHWDDPSKNWANVSSASWWRNMSKGFEYDGDNFTTNNFAHPYHGAMFFSAGRTNGYNFWESTVWSLTGSAIWEYFGETYRPAFNDWIYTGVGGANLGEITYRLSSMVTDNTASGSERVSSEIFGTLINPVRGFNRLISGEMGQNFPNPEWSRPENFLIAFEGGTRTIDKNGDEHFRDKEVEGLFSFRLGYGNNFHAKKPFEYFGFDFAIASGQPHFTQLNSTGYLFGYALEKNKHLFNVNLDFNYNNLIKEETTPTDTVYKGFLFGATQLYPHLLSKFPIGGNTNIVTQLGLNAILIGATPDDYFKDPEGRVYDFGPGVGTRVFAAIQNGIWNYVSILYYGAWLWTQSQPDNSKHHIHFLLLEAQYPLTSYFSFGIGAGVYWRNSYYESYEGNINGVDYSREASEVHKNHPIVRVFFRTAIIDL